jgi:hypothetical protein
MGGSGASLLVILVVLIGIAVLVINWQLRKRKVAAFRAFAARRGWRYVERDNRLAKRFLGAPFGKGSARRCTHVFIGEHRGRLLTAFEYIYEETSGTGDDRRTTTYRNTVVALSTPAARPTLEVSREGFGRKLLGLVGIRDLQLESDEFNKAFLIRAEDDKFAYDILHPRTMEWMLADQRCQDQPFRFERADLLTWRKGSIDLQTVVWLLDYLCDVLDRVPTYVWKP